MYSSMHLLCEKKYVSKPKIKDVTQSTAAHFELKLAGTILRHTFCGMEIEIIANLVPVYTEIIREYIHIEIYWFSF